MSIDFHTHILPGIDDGSRNVEMSLAMLEEEQQQQVDKIVATPHFYAGEDSVLKFLERRQRAYEKVEEALSGKEQSPKIYLGAEVYYFPGIGDASMIPKLCIEGTDILLLEMPFRQWERSMYEDVKKLIRNQKLTVVLAHIERFYDFQKNISVWDSVMELPVYVQMNAGPFLNWKKRRAVLRLLKNAGTVLLGSDCHNMDGRKPNLADGRAVIAAKLGNTYLEQVDQQAEELLGRY